MTDNQNDFVPNFSADDDEPGKPPTDAQAAPGSKNNEGIEVNIYFPADQAQGPDATRPSAPVPDLDMPTRPAVRSVDETPAGDVTKVYEPIPEFAPEPASIVRDEALTSDIPAERPGRRPLSFLTGLIIFLAALVCFGATALFVQQYRTGQLPPAIAALIPDSTAEAEVATATLTPGFRVTTIPTQTPRITSTPSTTPAVGVTALPAATRSGSTATPSVDDPDDNLIEQNGVTMVYVPGGTFPMGSTEFPSESPVHDVTLSPYYIDQYEVTNGSWTACVAAGECDPPVDTGTFDGTPYYGVTAYQDYPVIYVSWDSADAYCSWRGARLPTEAEWEMAARWDPDTKQVTQYPWGDDWDESRLNYCDSSCLIPDFKDATYDDNWPQTSPVGLFEAGVSPLGVYDMAGNVAEWVADWYSRSYYEDSPASDPGGPASGTVRVVRSGGWSLDSFWNRSTARNNFAPDSAIASIGFRCAVSADQIDD
jgi:formylglycine-generating enzyme required for sulfatase activity